jgi:VWFA-related protein
MRAADALTRPAGTVAESFQTSASDQQIYVSVLDQQDNPVVGLAADAFIVREDGIRREVLSVTKATGSFQIALVIDNSEAVRPYLRDLRAGLESFVKMMAGSHEMALFTIGDRPTIVTDYRNNPEELQAAVKRIFPRPMSGGHLLDTILNASRGLSRRNTTRPIILVVTAEGVDYSSRSYQSVLQSVDESGASLHAVVLTSSGAGLGTNARYRDMVLDRGTERTGGKRHDLLRGQRLQETLEALARELLNQYLVVYARPDMLVPPDRVEIEMSDASWVARGNPAVLSSEASPNEKVASSDPIESRYQLRIMERVFEQAVTDGAEQFASRIETSDPSSRINFAGTAQARGFRLDGYGVFFDVQVPMLRPSINWVFRQLNQSDLSARLAADLDKVLPVLRENMRTFDDEQLMENFERALLAFRRPLPPGSPMEPTRTGSQRGRRARRVASEEDLQAEYAAQIATEVTAVILDHSEAILLGADDWLVVATVASFSPNDTPGMKMMLKILGSDLIALRAGELSREDAIKRIETGEF